MALRMLQRVRGTVVRSSAAAFSCASLARSLSQQSPTCVYVLIVVVSLSLALVMGFVAGARVFPSFTTYGSDSAFQVRSMALLCDQRRILACL